MNYFNPKIVAERYSKGRPDFHSKVIKYIQDFMHLDHKVEDALDIACGTGLSTKALLAIAKNVYGTDTSEQMLNLAQHPDKINYSIAPAEQQPFKDRSFDLITVCSGVHWFNIDKFLEEAKRLLRHKSWLVLYDNFFLAEMVDNESFNNWFKNIYLVKFPSPSRNDKYDWSNKNLAPKNLTFVAEETFKNTINFNKKELILYFTTQSNIISSVQQPKTTYTEVELWLEKELSMFFDSEEATRTINYGNWIKFIQRAD